MLENRWFPLSFRIVTFFAFLALVFIGFSSKNNDPVFLRQLSRTNLTTSFVWDLWWPLIILSAIIFGRVWCMVCPVEMITTFFAKIGLKHKRPQWILSGWSITVFYAIIVIVGVTIFEIDFNPKYTASYLLIIVGISVVSGLIFEKNTFCRYICPVGYLLGIFSKLAIWGWRVKSQPVCKACPDKSCISNKYLYQLNYKSCGVDLFPARISDNNYCLLCGGCLKSCKEFQIKPNPLRPNPALVKIGFANDLMQINPLFIVEWVFLFFLSAHLIDEITEFRLITNISHYIIPASVSSYLNANIGKSLIGTGYLFFLFPLLLWISPYLLMLFARIRISFSSYLKNFSLIFLPIIIALFVGLIIMEIGTKLPYFKYIVHDVKGIETIQAILTRQISVTRLPNWTEWVFFLSMVLSLIAGVYLSFKIIRVLVIRFKIQKNITLLYILPFIFVLVFFSVAIIYRCFFIFPNVPLPH